MATHRRYTKRTKATALVAAEAGSVLAASEELGIPRSTIRYWLDKPQFAELRQNAREAMMEEVQVVARLAWQKLGEAIERGEIEARDLVMAAGMAVDKSQLLNGAATMRTELRDITGTITDLELIGHLALVGSSGADAEAEEPAEAEEV